MTRDLNGFYVGERVLVKTESELAEEFTCVPGGYRIDGEDYTMEYDDYADMLGCEAVISEIIEKEEYIDIYLEFDGKRSSRLFTVPVLKHITEQSEPPEVSDETLMAIAIGI